MIIAVVLCTLNNVDTVSLVGHLSTDPQMRDAAGKQALEIINSPRFAQSTSPPAAGEVPSSTADQEQLALQYKAALDKSTLPLWWSKSELNNLVYTIQYIRSNTEIPNAIQSRAPQPATGNEMKAVYHFSPNYSWLVAKFTGLLISILAVSMGAPFWFDVLNRLVDVRLVGKRPEPSVSQATLAPAANAAPISVGTPTTS